MKISIVIPVYNEAEQLAACLSAIGRQTLRPHEVIVIDNNSSDESAAIAQGFDFVRLLREPRQGVVHARNRGFDTASGEIIARIDADTLLPPAWLEQVAAIFTDGGTAAVSGAPHYYDFALDELADNLDWRLRARLAQQLGNNNFLWGANMALRRSAWRAVRGDLCAQSDMHEDFDLGIHLQAQNYQVAYKDSLIAGVSSRRIDTSFMAYIRYSLVSPRTYARHGLSARRHMYPVLLICWACYLPGRVIYRGIDPLTNSFSWRRLFALSEARVDPTSNIA